MLTLDLVRDPDAPFRVLALGAHCDDIEIGCGGTLLSLLSAYPNLCFDWVVFTSNPVRAREAQASAERFLRGAKEKRIVLKEFRNGYFPDQWARIKDDFEALKAEVRPDLILTHHAQDLHQDHRTVAERAELPFELVRETAELLETHELLRRAAPDRGDPAC